GQMSRAEHRLGPYEKRRHDLHKAVFAMDVEHVIEKRPFELRSKPRIERPAGAGEFCSANEVEEFELFIQFHMVKERKVKRSFFAPRPKTDIVFRAGRDRDV